MKKIITILTILFATLLYSNSQTCGIFNGNGSIEIPATQAITQFVNKISLEAWVNIPDTTFQSEDIHIISAGNQNRYSLTIWHDGKVHFALYGKQTIISNSIIPLNTWTHISAVYDGQATTTKIYINDILDITSYVNTGNIGIPYQGDHPSIGSYNDASNFFIGKIDDVRLWSVARTQSQISTYMCTVPVIGDTTLRGYFRLNFNYADTSIYHSNGINHQANLTTTQYCMLLTPPTLLAPANQSLVSQLPLVLIWNPVSNATSYTVQLSTGPNFINIVDSITSQYTLRLIPAGIIQNNSTYYWRVKANGGGSSSNWCDYWWFYTLNITGIRNISAEILIKNSLYQNYPNPFNPETKIKFDIATPNNIKLTVYDMLGNEIQRIIDRNLSAGTYEVSFNGSNLASGMYFYKLEVGNNVFVKKMMVIK